MCHSPSYHQPPVQIPCTLYPVRISCTLPRTMYKYPIPYLLYPPSSQLLSYSSDVSTSTLRANTQRIGDVLYCCLVLSSSSTVYNRVSFVLRLTIAHLYPSTTITTTTTNNNNNNNTNITATATATTRPRPYIQYSLQP